MKKQFIRNMMLLMVLVFSSVAVSLAQEHGEVHWGYEGEEGPENWGALSEEWEACSLGSAQSPIDISDATPINLNDIEVNYSESMMSIFNNGHTIQVNYDEGSSITYNEVDYHLLQFHFHHPSEHTINGEHSDMEIHFVHASDNGNLAVIGVMLNAGEDMMNDAYASVFENLPAETSDPDAMGMSMNGANMLPESTTFFTYNGSLTTPPCTEIVRWLVMTEPVTISAAEVEAFASIFEHNARPTEPLGNRDLFVDSE